jgi:hypothetical protein
MTELQKLYFEFRNLPFPKLGKRIGDFPLYDSLLAGCADRAVRGEFVDASILPEPDSETLAAVDILRQKPALNDEEHAFLRYFELLEDIRRLVMRND